MKLVAEILGLIFVRSVMIMGCLTIGYLCLTTSLAPAFLTISIATLSIRQCLFTIVKPHITFMFGNPQFSSIFIYTRGRLRLIIIDPLQQTRRTMGITTATRITNAIPTILALVEAEARTQFGPVCEGGLALDALPTVVVQLTEAGCHVGGPGGVYHPGRFIAGIVGAACRSFRLVVVTVVVSHHISCHMSTAASTTTTNSAGDGAGEEESGEQ